MFNAEARTIGHDAYWTPIEVCDLVEVPDVMFDVIGPAITRMTYHATCVFDIPNAAPMGEFYLVVDKQRSATLCAYKFMDQASDPIWIDTPDVRAAAVRFRDHCRRTEWRTRA